MKIYLILIILITTIIPNVASASWWNPISWFKQEIKIIDVPHESDVLNNNLDKVDDNQVINNPVQITKEIIKEVPVEKIIVKTVDSPELLNQINILKSEKNKCEESLKEPNNYESNEIRDLKQKKSDLEKEIDGMNKSFKIEKEQAISEAIKQGEENQIQKENRFFNELILDVENPSGGQPCLSDRIYKNKLDTFTYACKKFKERNFPIGER